MSSILLATLLCTARGNAQERHGAIQPAVRVDAFFARTLAIQAGMGVSVPAGSMLRGSLVGAIGGSTEHGRRGVSARIDGVARFLLDPTFATAWVPYAAGGMSLRYDRGPRWRGVLVFLLGMEGPPHDGAVPFVEAGWGGGVRVGFGLRRALRGRR